MGSNNVRQFPVGVNKRATDQSQADIGARIEATLPKDDKAEYERLRRIGHDGHEAWCRINHVGDYCSCGADNTAA